MKRKYLRKLAICLSIGVLLGEPAFAYAANEGQSSVTEQTEVETPSVGIPSEGESGENTETPSEGESGENTETLPGGEGGENTETPPEGEDGEDAETPPEGEDGEDAETPPEGEDGEGTETPPEGEDGEDTETPPEGEDGEDTETPPEGEDGEDTETPEEGEDGEDTETPEEEDGEDAEIPVEDEDTTEIPEEIEEEELLEDELLEEELLEVAEEEEIVAAGGVWNITDFGAVDGQDSTYAINQALGRVTASDSTVLIPRGTYKLAGGWLNVPDNARIVFESGASLVGDGAVSGFLIKGSNVRIENPVIKNVKSGITTQQNVSNLYVEGGELQASDTGILLKSISKAEIRNVKITGSKLGVLANGGNNLTVMNCEFANHSQGGIWIQGNATQIVIDNNRVKASKTAGIWLDNCKTAAAVIRNNTITENGTAGDDTTTGLKINASSDVNVYNNTISNNKQHGINISTGSVATVSENTIQSNGLIGVCIGSNSNVQIQGNTIKQNNSHGILIMNAYGAISNNTIDGTNSVGSVQRAEHYGIIIFCRNSADKSRVMEIKNNKVSGMVGNGIQVTGDKANPANEGAINVSVTNNEVSNVGDNGITVNYNSHNAVIKSNTVTSAGVNGIDIQGGSKNCTVEGNVVKNSGNMGINIGAVNTGAGANVVSNKVDASKNAGIHVTHSASTGTVSDNEVTNHSGNFSIAIVKGAKVALKGNKVIMPMDYISKYAGVAQYAIFVDGTTTTNGAVKFNFKPDIPAVGAKAFTGSGTPGLNVSLTLNNGTSSAKINSQWRYSISCSALKATDGYRIAADDAYGNKITYTSGIITNEVDTTKVKAFVERMYTVALNRPSVNQADPGFNYWVNELVTGSKDGATVAKGFILSKEMENRKLSNEQYVVMLYKTFFDRAPAANDSGKKYWINLLENGVSRAYVFRGFCHSQEFTNICSNYGIIRGNITLTESRDQSHDVTMYVFRCYDRTLGRQPDVNGLNFWTEQIRSKKRTPEDVAGNFVFSTEFKNKKLSDEEYVKVLYRMFFDREYNAPGTDPNGIKFWLNELKTGKRDRYGVFTGFANSKEFKIVLQKFGL